MYSWCYWYCYCDDDDYYYYYDDDDYYHYYWHEQCVISDISVAALGHVAQAATNPERRCYHGAHADCVASPI